MDPLIKKYFQILGVSKYSSPEEIKQAYKDLARVWHPDRFIDNPRLQKKATEKLKEINIAYEKLQSFYEHKNSHDSTSVYAEEIHEENFAEELPAAPVEEIRTIFKGYRFLIWMLAICTLVILTIIAIIYTDFKNKRSDLLTSPIISIPNQTESSKSAVEDPSSGKPTVQGKPSVKTATNATKKYALAKKEYFTLGSTSDEVLAIQGTPTQISGKRWSYGFSYIDFENGRVIRWYNSKQDPLLVEQEP